MAFVTVKYADNQSEIINPNCKNDVLLGHIKQRCRLPESYEIELSDEKGNVKQLHFNLDDYGSDYLRDREILILLKINDSGLREEEVLTEDDVTYTPLLEGLTEDSQFLGQLNPSANMRKKRRNMKNNASALNKKEKSGKAKYDKQPSVPAQN